jgi:hypothetical protein
VNVNTAYYDKGIIVYDRYKILLNYFRNNFLTDIMYMSKFYNKIFKNIIVHFKVIYLFLLYLQRLWP